MAFVGKMLESKLELKLTLVNHQKRSSLRVFFDSLGITFLAICAAVSIMKIWSAFLNNGKDSL